MSEHRRFIRWQINRQAKFKLEQAVEEVFFQVRDINYKGVQVILNAKLPEDAAFRLNLRFSEECNFEAEVWVAWHKIVDGINHYGLYFSKIRDADKNKIYNFICTSYPNDLKEKWWVIEQVVHPEETD
ncbi:MAG: PilZ domain-containing protein, partial [Candidatus Omnitrophica bacterium]|nr:PilZ domain-containing protein [Candidatus Omnitrophota bacterium]